MLNSEKNVEESNICEQLVNLIIKMNDPLSKLILTYPIAYVYNPLEYAFDVHLNYIKRYCINRKKVLFLGMNPGRSGMCQTGVPFGDVRKVRDWLKIDGKVSKPQSECPNNKICGFACKKPEPSGSLFWTLIENLYQSPERFFQSAFVYNYCPLAFLLRNGSNFTLQDIDGDLLAEIESICDGTLYDIIQLLNIELVVGIGRYAEMCCRRVLKKFGNSNVKVMYLKHPSPRVLHNENWLEEAEHILRSSELFLDHFES